MHFDEVLITLAAQHGGRRVEHMVVTLTAQGKEWKIGVYEILNGTGIQFLNISERFFWSKTGNIA